MLPMNEIFFTYQDKDEHVQAQLANSSEVFFLEVVDGSTDKEGHHKVSRLTSNQENHTESHGPALTLGIAKNEAERLSFLLFSSLRLCRSVCIAWSDSLSVTGFLVCHLSTNSYYNGPSEFYP